MNTRKGSSRKRGKLAWLTEEWVFQLVLLAGVVGALVERGIASSGGAIV